MMSSSDLTGAFVGEGDIFLLAFEAIGTVEAAASTDACDEKDHLEALHTTRTTTRKVPYDKRIPTSNLQITHLNRVFASLLSI